VDTAQSLKIQDECARCLYETLSSRMENLVVRKRHAGFGPAVEGEALVGNYRQAPHPTGMSSAVNGKRTPNGSWRCYRSGLPALA
jgi:hypothetical protein